MSTSVTFNGVVYNVPAEGDSNWGTNVSSYLISISTGCLQKTGGVFNLTTEVDFGATFGLKTPYIKSKATNPASAGFLRLGNTETIKWRNAANSGDLDLTVSALDTLQFNGFNVLYVGAGALTNLIVNSDVNASAAIAYSKLNLSSSIVDADISGSAAITYSKLNLGTSIVNADINAAAAIAYSKLSLALSIVDGDISSSAAISLSKLAALTLGRVVQTNASTGVLEASSVTNTQLSYLDATSSIQTQLNGKQASGSYALTTGKLDQFAATSSAELAGVISDETGSGALVFGTSPTLTTPTIDIVSLDGQASTPASPASGFYKAYVKDSTGKLTILNSAGTETAVGGGTGGSKNYLTDYKGNAGNGDFELNATTGWSLGHSTIDATTKFLTGSPTFGSGFTAGLTMTIVSSGQLSGLYSLNYAASGATTAGDFLASSAFTIDIEDQAKMMSFKFSYKAVTNPNNMNFSGTSANSYGVAIYDVTNSAWIQPSGVFNLVQSSGVGTASGSFQTTSNSTQYRIVLYNANATAGAVGLYVDSFFVGPQSTSYGAAMSDWTSFTPTGTWTTNTTYTGKYRRVGDSAEIQWSLALTGAPTAAQLLINVPSGLIIDTSKIAGTDPGSEVVGFGGSLRTAVSNQTMAIRINGNTQVVPIISNVAGTYNVDAGVTATQPVTWGNGDNLVFRAFLPIVGWSSNTVQSSDTATNVVSWNVNTAGALTTTDGGLVYSNVVKDTNGGYSSGVYTVRVSGTYTIKGGVRLQAASATIGNAVHLTLLKNGAREKFLTSHRVYATNSMTREIYGTTDVDCVAGDTLQLNVLSDFSVSTDTTTLVTQFNYFQGERISGPATIQASESVNALYTQSSGQTLTATGIYIMSTRVFDTHLMYNNATGVLTFPMSGKYRVSWSLQTNNTTDLATTSWNTSVRKNSSVIATQLGTNAGIANNAVNTGSYVINALAGDTFDLFNTTAHSVGSLINSSLYNWLSIERVGN